MKVSINAGGREVTIETASDTNLSHEQVAKAALDVWKQTDGAPSGTEGPAYGFSAVLAAERRPSSSMRRVPEVPE